MDYYGSVSTVIDNAASTTLAFFGNVINDFWGLFLSLALLALAIGAIKYRIGFGH